MENIYEDIAARTGGDIYIGVVGPVRTGKSTFIKRFMEKAVIPRIEDPYRTERARDELPQSGSGRTIMTSEPKFVPDEAVEISPDGKTSLRVRLIDSVGYMVDGAMGALEGDQPRMVTTPWFDYEIPMPEAAEIGTKKVMEEHCSIGLVITTDGTVTDIPRQDHQEAESKAIEDMKATGKAFLVLVNSREPGADQAKKVCKELQERHGVRPMIVDCQAMEQEDIMDILKELLYVFPMTELQVDLPRWMDALEQDHPLKASIYSALLERVTPVKELGRAEEALKGLEELEQVTSVSVSGMDLGKGTVRCAVVLPQSLYYDILTERTGLQIRTESQLLQTLTELARIRKEYSIVADALASVKATGYGVVSPNAEDMHLEKPEVIRKGGAYGVKLKATAPSIHMVRVDIDTEISPMVGDEKQSRDLITYLGGEDPEKLWQSNIFGRSVHDLIQEGLGAKLLSLPDDVRAKFRGTLTRIVNEGATGLICLIL